VAVGFKKGSKKKSQEDDKSETNKLEKSQVDDVLTSDNLQLSNNSTNTKQDKPSEVAVVKSNAFRLLAAPKGVSSCGIAYSQNGIGKSLQLKLSDGVYELEEKDFPKVNEKPMTKGEFIKLLNKNGFKPIYEEKSYSAAGGDNSKTETKSYKLMHPDYSLHHENYTGDFVVEAQDQRHTLKIENGILLTDNKAISDSLERQGFELLGK